MVLWLHVEINFIIMVYKNHPLDAGTSGDGQPGTAVTQSLY